MGLLSIYIYANSGPLISLIPDILPKSLTGKHLKQWPFCWPNRQIRQSADRVSRFADTIVQKRNASHFGRIVIRMGTRDLNPYSGRFETGSWSPLIGAVEQQFDPRQWSRVNRLAWIGFNQHWFS